MFKPFLSRPFRCLSPLTLLTPVKIQGPSTPLQLASLASLFPDSRGGALPEPAGQETSSI
jgi:hypothetical protein